MHACTAACWHVHRKPDPACVGCAPQVLGKRRSDGSALISVSEMRDGIVTFEDEADAARFASLLSAQEADSQAEVIGSGSSCCFRMASPAACAQTRACSTDIPCSTEIPRAGSPLHTSTGP